MTTNNSANIGTAASGRILQGAGTGVAPSYSTATYPATATVAGTILRADGTNWVQSTPTYPNAASTSGKVVVSDGTNLIMSTPTFPNTSATSRKIIVSDGTNWIASTETYAVPGTSGNVLTSDGTNWTSAAPTFLIASVTLTSAQIKALRATPIQIIAAPGSGKGIVVVGATAKLTYGGTNAFTAAAAQTIALYYNNSVTLVNGATGSLIPNAMITSTANKFSINMATFSSTNQVAAVLDNVNVAARNTVATEISGNAANNNTITINVGYYIITF